MKSLPLDFVLNFCKEKINDHGEDSFCYSFSDNIGIVAVFDGCGGAGAQTHKCYDGHTEAYMASRFASGALYSLFLDEVPTKKDTVELLEKDFFGSIYQVMKNNSPPKEDKGFQIKGSMIRTLPTTAAVALIKNVDGDKAEIDVAWAGDSRVYILNADGLAQLTIDDTTVPDPMENLYEDGILQNILCSDKPAKIHCETVKVNYPFIVFSATDGCFGYVSTPMEFESLLLGTLAHSESASDWETRLSEEIGAVAGDDHTMSMATFGYGGFEKLKDSFSERYLFLENDYIKSIRELPMEDRQSRILLWEKYKDNYLRYTQRT